MGPAKPETTSDASGFPSTWWALIRAVQHGGDPETARACFGRLVQVYWHSVYVFFRSRGQDAPRAAALSQAFLAQLCAADALPAIDPNQVRFRVWLHTALSKFLSEAQPLAPLAQAPVVLDFEAAERRFQRDSAPAGTAERQFERAWALALLERALVRFKQEYVTAGKAELYASICGFLAIESSAPAEPSTSALKMAVQRGRQRLRRLVREEIAQLLDLPADNKDHELHRSELEALRAALEVNSG